MNDAQQPLGILLAPLMAGNANMAEHLLPSDVTAIEQEVAVAFEGVLAAMRIDVCNDPHTHDTAKRYAKMVVREVCRGRFEPPPVVATFPNTNELDELVTVGPITVRSMCSHHFCPVLGRAWVGYIPRERLAGLSKFARVVDYYAARPQVQEEMVQQIARHLWTALEPAGVAVVVKAQHTCMTWRGVRESTASEMTSSVMLGVFRDKPEARAEFLELIREA